MAQKTSPKNTGPRPAGWRAYRHELRFLVLFLVLLGLSFTVVSLTWVNDHVIEPFTALVAKVSGVALNVIGQEVTRDGSMLASERFRVNIKNGCNGVETMLIFMSAVLAFPATWRSRLSGLGLGLLAIQGINLVRVVALFLTGAYFPKLFDASHTVIWQTVVILFGFLLWIFWANRYATQKPAATAPASD
jgi:exosortase H (IPTLxxWG-CTERM-specific)